jgi:putative colanic acid biosynthesis glycosyltransferase
MRKILIINTTLNKGGAARIAYDLFLDLSNDFNIFFAYGRGNKNKDSKTFYFGNKLEVFIHLFLVRFLGLEGFGSYFSTKKLIKFIEKEKFDLINIHNLHGYYLNFFQLLNFLKEKRIKIIYSVHDEWPITWLPAHSLGCKHCKDGGGLCTNTYSYPKNYFPIFRKFMLNRKRKIFSEKLEINIICPSQCLKNSIENSFLDKFNIQVINHGIDTDIFKPTQNKNQLREKYNLPLNKKIVVFSASNIKDKNKGINQIIETADILRDKNYLFIGLGNGKIIHKSNIKTLGYIYDKKELQEIYALSDIFCFASKAETFLLAAAEALSCGIPVVGFDIDVVKEFIDENVGILTKNDSYSLAKSIDNLLKNEEKIFKMGEAGRKLIENNYSKNIFCDNYKKIYEK